MIKRYSALRRFETFEERYRYLSLGGSVGCETFGPNRWLNQDFYASAEWRRVRRDVILRDNSCDLGIEGHEIHDRIYIHHMNPMNIDDIVHKNDDNLDPEFLICVTHQTHNAIHYGDESQLPRIFTPRRPGDTRLW